MRVGIDAYAIGSRNGGGEIYVRNLIRALAGVHSDIDYTLFLTPKQAALEPAGTEHMHRVIVGPNSLPIRIPLGLPVAAARHQLDVLHADHMSPPLSPARLVITLHDISWERYPQFFNRTDVLKNRVMMPVACRRAAALITSSQFSKDDIVRRYRVSPDRITVAAPGSDSMFRPLHDQERLNEARARYAGGAPYLLSVGNLEPRKNLRTLIDAYVRLRRAGAIPHKLLLVGRSAWLYDETFAAARDSGYADDLVFTGYVPDRDLVALYNAADLFVYPSLFEGFGLPPLEAMACGTPVVAADTSSLPEVVGDAGLLVHPLDAEALARAMVLCLTDAERRALMSHRGIERARRFSWDRTAQLVASVYRSVMS